MHDAFEFSDVEIEEPLRKRTRSQSRMKETSVPPAELETKVTKVRRGAKKVDAEKKPRRRRVIKEETIELNTDDEWTNLNFLFFYFIFFLTIFYVFAVWLKSLFD